MALIADMPGIQIPRVCFFTNRDCITYFIFQLLSHTEEESEGFVCAVGAQEQILSLNYDICKQQHCFTMQNISCSLMQLIAF